MEALAQLLAPVSAPLQQLIGAIRHCISAEDGRILDRASERLAQVAGCIARCSMWWPSVQGQLLSQGEGAGIASHALEQYFNRCSCAQVRGERSANAAELRAAMADWSRRLHASGVSERAQVCWKLK